jgi:hypothetical protein
MILVFGGVVLVWSHLIDFLKDVLIRYPEVKDGLSENKLLEQVLIRYISDIPKIKSKLSSSHILEVYKDHNECDIEDSSRTTIAVQPSTNNKMKLKKSSKISNDNSLNHKILEPRKPNCCFFCLKEDQHFLITACLGWSQLPSPSTQQTSEDQGEIKAAKVITICTPYTEMAKMRDDMNKAATDAAEEVVRIKDINTKLELKRAEAISIASKLQSKVNELETASIRAQITTETQLAAERRQRDIDVQSIIAEHNHQLTELKRLFKAKMKKNTNYNNNNNNDDNASNSTNNYSNNSTNNNTNNNTTINNKTSCLSSQKVHNSTGDIEAPKTLQIQKNTKLKSQSQSNVNKDATLTTFKKNANNNTTNNKTKTNTNTNNVNNTQQPILDYYHGQSASDNSFQSIDTNTTDGNINDDRLWLSSTEYDEIERLLSSLHNPFYLSSYEFDNDNSNKNHNSDNNNHNNIEQQYSWTHENIK